MTHPTKSRFPYKYDLVAGHDFKDDSNCSKCNCYGPDEEALPCIEEAIVQGTINAEGDWEPMVSIPISEYEGLMNYKFMYESLNK